MSWLSRLANAFRSRSVNRELDEELRFHIEERTEELSRGGIPPEEAVREARRMLGGVPQLRESSRDIKTLLCVDSVFRDAQFGLRMLRKNRVVTCAAILSLSLAIGACTAAFSLIDALILRPLPVKEPEGLVYLVEVHDGDEFAISGYPLFERLRDAGREYVDLFAMSYINHRHSAVFDQSGGQDEKVRAQFVSGGTFANLGVAPALGRVLTNEDDDRHGAHPVAVLSHNFWKRRFGRDPNVIGRWLTMEKKSLQIIGVAQEGFWGVEPGLQTDLWLPITMSDSNDLTEPHLSWFRIWGRVKPGVQSVQARQALQAAFIESIRENTRLLPGDRERFERWIRTLALTLRSAANGPSSMRNNFERPLWILALVAGLVLLIACSNVANLLIARAAAREGEMALRISIGASRSRLMQQVLIESVLLAAMASILAVTFAVAVAPTVVTMLSAADNPAYLDLRIDWRIAGFVALLCGFTTILFGVAPALRASTVSPDQAVKRGGQKQSVAAGIFRPLVAVQVAFSFVVLFVAGLLLLTFQKLTSVNPGFAKNGMLLFSVDMTGFGNSKQARQLALQLQDHVRQLRGVDAVSLSGWSLFGGDMWVEQVRPTGKGQKAVDVWYLPVSPGFFATMGIKLLQGREFEARDLLPDESTTVIVNEAFVRQTFPDNQPLGKTFVRSGSPKVRQEIVGIVRDAKYNNLREQDPPTVYVPFWDGGYQSLEVRTAVDPLVMVSKLREEIKRVHPLLTITDVNLQSTLINNTLLRERLLALLSGFFASVALALVAVGLYGVLNYSVVRRTKEIGIRIALGARELAVIRLVISEITLLVVSGLAAGVCVGLWFAKFFSTLLFEVEPSDFWSLTLPLACLLVTAVLAATPPTMRAARVDPIAALRQE